MQRLKKNWTSIIFLTATPLLGVGGTLAYALVNGVLWWQPVLVALTFIAGQAFTFVALQRGDVSVATPMLGIKILLVALLTRNLDPRRHLEPRRAFQLLELGFQGLDPRRGDRLPT